MFLIFIFQGKDIFDDPYESREIGWVRAWDISLTPQRWCASDVVSKCYCFPNSMSQRSMNPLPDSIRKETTLLQRTKQFNQLFDKSDLMVWNIVPLLLPPDIVLERIGRFIDKGWNLDVCCCIVDEGAVHYKFILSSFPLCLMNIFWKKDFELNYKTSVTVFEVAIFISMLFCCIDLYNLICFSKWSNEKNIWKTWSFFTTKTILENKHNFGMTKIRKFIHKSNKTNKKGRHSRIT